ncbi:protein-L-isoaspartate O-methyltransferase [Bradyrhizobium sediminis]|uniref:Protein-L-isoaspartate O-methyltransferase n=1 Tax=Bradyrhizobium sediminis TaxID=2840469 RepID=A0A975RMX5_9BRAD|nr:protein-L-isoaspartate O-methyltransferase [Bradyrhizobium sediminis]QWG13153.1 protein-L-isoaspartate O-methyltransferase [Bradyrhizobium sediminis]
MNGWQIPSPRKPSKSKADFARERREKVASLIKQGLLKSELIKKALLKVPREDFIPRPYRDYAYLEVPLPLPGLAATISCPHSYPLFYEPLGLDQGHRFLEVGLGSGYGAAVAREVVGEEGQVVSMEIDPVTFKYAKANLERAGYRDVVLVLADGGLGYPELQPYDRIALTAACMEIPAPLLEQLAVGGRLIAPVTGANGQDLTVFEKSTTGVSQKIICTVLYVNLRGQYGIPGEQDS